MRDLQVEIDRYLRRGELVPALRLLAAAVDQHEAQVNFRLQRLENRVGMGHAMDLSHATVVATTKPSSRPHLWPVRELRDQQGDREDVLLRR